jgi:hypothetical protein
MRTRSKAYRERRKLRHAARRNRASEYRDYLAMLQATPGYVEMLERVESDARMLDYTDEWEATHEALPAPSHVSDPRLYAFTQEAYSLWLANQSTQGVV